ncbi:hypothetical protein BV898_15871 [Hypsibius exemplaris]|uniref:Uncharacterized protein n=1 Tax=Hypsibius exemplaris TaxID=2072580 RepID=A0A9X6NIJ9_HYPEX|nr:hypothetical protein BV898_15871 [Hypsibius exemplaris]
MANFFPTLVVCAVFCVYLCKGQQFQFSRLWHPGKRSSAPQQHQRNTYTNIMPDEVPNANGEVHTQEDRDKVAAALAILNDGASDDSSSPPIMREPIAANDQQWIQYFVQPGQLAPPAVQKV